MEMADLSTYERFLRERGLVPERQLPFYIGWIKRYLLSSVPSRDLKDDDKRIVFNEVLSQDRRVQEWQLEQADRALVLYQSMFASSPSAPRSPEPAVLGPVPAAPAATIPAPSCNLTDALRGMREVLRLRHLAYNTEKSYCRWVQRYYYYVGEHGLALRDVGSVRAFLSALASRRNLAASSQNQALSALLMLFRDVLRIDVGDLSKTVRAKRGKKLPVVLTFDEMRSVLEHAKGVHLLHLQVLYGSGLRVSELARLCENGVTELWSFTAPVRECRLWRCHPAW